jgi:dTDP-4-dehydrorhamnose 3,5-epimerase
MIKVWTPKRFADDRGFFTQIWQNSVNRIPGTLVQMNMSVSKKGTIRGLHLQTNPPMGKAMWVASGAAIIYAVQCRPEGDAEWKQGDIVACRIEGDEPRVFYADAGYARGFIALEDNTVVCYATTAEYNGLGEHGFNPFSAGINYPRPDEFGLEDYVVSEKDRYATTFEEWKQSKMFLDIDWGKVE